MPVASADSRSALLLALLPLLTACGGTTVPDRSPLDEALTADIPLFLRVEVEDSLLLPCPEGAPVAEAPHWATSASQVRLDPDQTARLRVEIEDRPPSGLGEPRCGGEGVEWTGLRPGRFAAGVADVIEFSWESVAEPDPTPQGVVTDQVWLSDAVPVGPRSLTADLRVRGVQILVGLTFLTSQTPDGL